MRKVVSVAHGPVEASLHRDLPRGVVAVTRHDPYTKAPPEHPSDVDSVWMIWLDDEADALDAANVVLPVPSTAYLVDERRQWDDLGDERPARDVSGVTRISFIRRVAPLSRAEFASHWSDVHAPLARVHHPAIRRYVQNVVVDPLTPDAPDIDGIAELHFHSYDDLVHRMYDSDRGRTRVQDDVRTFIDVPLGWRILSTEHNVWGTPPRTIPA